MVMFILLVQKSVMIKYFHKTKTNDTMVLINDFFNVEGLDANRMLFLCDIFNINLCEILNKNQFLCPKIHYYSLFTTYLASLLKLCTTLAHLCH